MTFQAGTRRGPDAFTYSVSDGEFTTPPTVVVLSVVEPHWLSPLGNGARDGRSPEGAWAAGSADALDAIWHTNNYYDCFYYAPGVYETRGWHYYNRSTAEPGCKHVGSGTEGPSASTVRLVDIWEQFVEEMIFAPAYFPKLVDNFEVHHLVLDCNAANLPKYKPGLPESVRIPLRSSGRVESVTLHWAVEFVIPQLLAGPAGAQTVERVYILDCGQGRAQDTSRWTPGVNVGVPMDLVDHCYLIRHRQGWMMWDTGVPERVAQMPDGLVGGGGSLVWKRPKTIAAQLAEIGVKPEDVRVVAVSHTHGDNVGNVDMFTASTVFIQKAEY